MADIAHGRHPFRHIGPKRPGLIEHCSPRVSNDRRVPPDDRMVRPTTRLLGLLQAARREVTSGRSSMTAQQFAEAVNCAQGTLRRYLRGERPIPGDVLSAWERVTGLVPGTLFGAAGDLPLSYLLDERPPLPGAAQVGTDVFVGRFPDLGRLEGLGRVAPTARRLAVVRGDPGVGKTGLAAAAARRAYDEGCTVLWGRCDEHLSLPFQPFAEALRAFVPNFGGLIRGPAGPR